MPAPTASPILIIPGVRPGVFFTPALGLVLTDWYTAMPLSTGVGAAVLLEDPRLQLFYVPFKLSFARISYYITLMPDHGEVDIALYSDGPIDKIWEVNDTVPGVGVRTVSASLVFEPGIYWSGARTRTAAGAPTLRLIAAPFTELLWVDPDLPPGSGPYGGWLVPGAFPQTFDPATDFTASTSNGPLLRFTTV